MRTAQWISQIRNQPITIILITRITKVKVQMIECPGECCLNFDFPDFIDEDDLHSSGIMKQSGTE